ncbi:DUF3182 family protein [Pusillimonas sp. SM2304]|uniref:DUF3182 family protein n=1 Tax=Pusillimonas sp. SM2304 TaxID=3073241 RepID=UPI002874FF51|nr:DUF3182 family protein [Pusillimonas sp. SM2304]MDS1142305.1 DUF3182 family protein [Pusillimonas sp. SM2304]
MGTKPDSPGRHSPGTVIVYPARKHEPEHERTVHLKLGARIADVLGMHFGGLYDAACRYDGPLYTIPTCTLIGTDIARQLGIRSTGDLYGGVAPAAFVPTKAITHALLHADACAPAGWSHAFGRDIQDSVLAGITSFTLDDAREAGGQLLRDGPVRIKPVLATGGRGQQVVSSQAELNHALDAQDQDELACYGLVLEENLNDVSTFSVGQARIGGIVASYVGTQCLTQDNNGEMVYGGSDLIIVRGDFDRLLDLSLSTDFQTAISKAQVYDQAALRCFTGLIASRRNYDIASGTSSRGEPRCGVLEQSWRIGGASAAEIAAIQAFHEDEQLQSVRAMTVELFGSRAEPPAGAEALFSGIDPELGPLNKYVKVQPYGN